MRIRAAELGATGTFALVYFGVDWCLSCKINEFVAMHSGAVRTALAQAQFVPLTGDWTWQDLAIRRFLVQHPPQADGFIEANPLV